MTLPVFTLTVPDAVRQIRRQNPSINAFVNMRLSEALTDGDARAREPARTPVHGVPYGLKDEWETRCLPTTGGSFRHRARRSTHDSRVFEVFDQAGAVLLGKTSLSDLGLAPESSNYICGSTRNPFDTARTAGGSSGGAAAAIATGMTAFDWGTDIGGSIRQPAAFCSIVGIRLSHETWPIRDLFPRVPSVLDWLCGQGPMASTLDQLRCLLDVTGPALRTGTPRDFEFEGIALYVPDHLGRWPTFARDMLAHLTRTLDCEVTTDHGLPGTDEAIRAYAGTWSAHLEDLLEADPDIGGLVAAIGAMLSALILRGLLGDRRFHPQCAELVIPMALGRITIFRDKQRALQSAYAVRDAFGDVWSRGRIVVAPVCMYPAPRVGRTNYNTHIIDCLAPGNLADATGLSVPFGRFGHLPRAIQLLGPPGSELLLLDLAERLAG